MAGYQVDCSRASHSYNIIRNKSKHIQHWTITVKCLHDRLSCSCWKNV